jgi:hypothetical protein
MYLHENNFAKEGFQLCENAEGRLFDKIVRE